MRTIKRTLVLTILFLLAGTSIVSAFGSSFSYAAFQQLVGTYIVPFATSNGYATELQAPAVTAASSSAATGSLTRGPLFMEVAALTLTGTSSPSNEIATSSQGTNSEINLTWPQTPGATGYAVYIGTSTPGSEQSYFMATSTSGQVNNYYTLQSTSSPTYYTVPFQGIGYYTTLNSASTSVDTTGFIRAEQQATTSACSTSLNGTMFYNAANSHLWLCTGSGPLWTVVK